MSGHTPANLWDLEHPGVYICRHGMDTFRQIVRDVEEALGDVFEQSINLPYVNPYENYLEQWLERAYDYLRG